MTSVWGEWSWCASRERDSVAPRTWGAACGEEAAERRVEKSAKRGSPRKRREDPLPSRGLSRRDSTLSPSTSAVEETTGRPVFPRDCLFLPPRRTTRIETELLPLRRAKRRVFRVRGILEDLNQSSRESRLIVNVEWICA